MFASICLCYCLLCHCYSPIPTGAAFFCFWQHIAQDKQSWDLVLNPLLQKLLVLHQPESFSIVFFLVIPLHVEWLLISNLQSLWLEIWITRFLTNSYLREEAPNSHVVEQRVEWQVYELNLIFHLVFLVDFFSIRWVRTWKTESNVFHVFVVQFPYSIS